MARPRIARASRRGFLLAGVLLLLMARAAAAADGALVPRVVPQPGQGAVRQSPRGGQRLGPEERRITAWQRALRWTGAGGNRASTVLGYAAFRWRHHARPLSRLLLRLAALHREVLGRGTVEQLGTWHQASALIGRRGDHARRKVEAMADAAARAGHPGLADWLRWIGSAHEAVLGSEVMKQVAVDVMVEVGVGKKGVGGLALARHSYHAPQDTTGKAEKVSVDQRYLGGGIAVAWVGVAYNKLKGLMPRVQPWPFYYVRQDGPDGSRKWAVGVNLPFLGWLILGIGPAGSYLAAGASPLHLVGGAVHAGMDVTVYHPGLDQVTAALEERAATAIRASKETLDMLGFPWPEVYQAEAGTPGGGAAGDQTELVLVHLPEPAGRRVRGKRRHGRPSGLHPQR
jgi:hypothetical protein